MNPSSGDTQGWVLGAHADFNDNHSLAINYDGTSGKLCINIYAISGWTSSLSGCSSSAYYGWHNVVFTSQGTLHSLYIDGNLKGNYTGNSITSTYPLSLCSVSYNHITSGYSCSNMTLDEAAIWNRVLNSNDITTLWNNGIGLNLATPSTDCGTGCPYCVNSKCRLGDGTCGANCGDSTDCGTGCPYCVNSKCNPYPGTCGATCVTNSNCAPGCPYCNNGVCSSAGIIPQVTQANSTNSIGTAPLTADTFSYNYCVSGAPGTGGIFFGWTYVDTGNNPESRFNFQIDNNSDFSSPEVDRRYCNINLGGPPSINNQTTSVVPFPASSIQTYCSGTSYQYTVNTPDALSYNTTYYWRVRVYDNQTPTSDSGWVNGVPFTTPAHALPSPSFGFSPTNPTVTNTVAFKDSSTCYNADNTNQSCRTETGITYKWTGTGINNVTTEDTSYKYTSPGTYTANLQACDAAGCCSTTFTNNVKVKTSASVPQWKEISPF
jgi:hypothetical protein